MLKYLLGVNNVKNYDGSWTEWGNLVGAPIEKPRRTDDFTRRQQQLSGWSIVVETYRAGDTFYCTVSSEDPGARFARGQGPSRDDAERVALEKAERWLGQTRRFGPGA